MDSFLFKSGMSGSSWSRVITRPLPNGGLIDDTSVGAGGGLQINRLDAEVPMEVEAAVRGELLCFLSTLLRKHIVMVPTATTTTTTTCRSGTNQTAQEGLLVDVVSRIQALCATSSKGAALSPNDRWNAVLGLLVATSVDEAAQTTPSSLLPAALWRALSTSWSGGGEGSVVIGGEASKSSSSSVTLGILRRNPITTQYEQFVSTAQRSEGWTKMGWMKVPEDRAPPLSTDEAIRLLEEDLRSNTESTSHQEEGNPITTATNAEESSTSTEDDIEGLILSFRKCISAPGKKQPISCTTTMSEGVTLTLLNKCLDFTQEKVGGACSSYTTPMLVLGAFVDSLALQQAHRDTGNLVLPHLPTTTLFMRRLCVKCANIDSSHTPLPPPSMWVDTMLPREHHVKEGEDETTLTINHQQTLAETAVDSPMAAEESKLPVTTVATTPQRIRTIPAAAQRQIAKTHHNTLESSFNEETTPTTHTVANTTPAGWTFSHHEREEYLHAVHNINTEPPMDGSTLKDLFYQLATEDGGNKDRLDKEVFIGYLQKAYPVADCGDPQFLHRLVHSAHVRPCVGGVDPITGRRRRVADYCAPTTQDSPRTSSSTTSWGGLAGGDNVELLKGDACAMVGKLHWEHEEHSHPLIAKYSKAALLQSLASREGGGSKGGIAMVMPSSPRDSITRSYMASSSSLKPSLDNNKNTQHQQHRAPRPMASINGPQELQYANSWLEQGVQRRLQKEREAIIERQTLQARRPEPPSYVTESEFITVIQRLGCKM